MTTGRRPVTLNLGMRNKDIKEQIEKISLGVFNTVIDLSLFLFAFWAQSYRVGSGKKDLFEALGDAGRFVKFIRKERFKRGIYEATKRKFLTKEKGVWQITESGQKRLESVLPIYFPKRRWKRRIYLIAYDIPETRRKDRALLREYLKKLGCGMFQESVWLTPYDPRHDLADFIAQYKLSGLVVVSDIGKDGNVGQVPIRELIEKVYKLDKFNERYQDFLQSVEEKRLTPWEINFSFLSILKEDPQLPFELLPDGWLGERAFRVFQKYSSDIQVGKI